MIKKLNKIRLIIVLLITLDIFAFIIFAMPPIVEEGTGFSIIIYEVIRPIKFLFATIGILLLPIIFYLYDLVNKIKIEDRKLFFEKEKNKLISSGDYKIIKNFVSKYKTILPKNIYKYYIFIKHKSHKKFTIFTILTTDFTSVLEYKNAINIYHITKLQTLINSKGFNFSIKDICSLIDREKQIQEYDDFKTKMLFNDPKGLEDYIKNLIEIYGENYIEYREFLRSLLKSKKVEFSDYGLIDIANFKKKMELDRFEKDLESKEPYFVSMEEVDLFTGYDFEYFLNTLFKKMSYSVEHTKLSGDQGADLIVSKLGEKIIVQAKRHTSKISNKAVQEVVASIKHFKADKGMVVTNNYFTNSAIELAESNNIELIDRDMLSKLIEKYL